MKDSLELTAKYLLLIKPDGNVYFNEIVNILSQNQVKILSIKCKKLTTDEVEGVYRDHKDKYFFSGLLDYMTMDKVFIFAVESRVEDITKAKLAIRELAKQHAARQVLPALIAWLKSIQQEDAVKLDVGKFSEKFVSEYLKTFDGIHCSDLAVASREVKIFFDPEELGAVDFDMHKSAMIVSAKVKLSEVYQKIKFSAESEGQNLNFFSNSK